MNSLPSPHVVISRELTGKTSKLVPVPRPLRAVQKFFWLAYNIDKKATLCPN